MNRFFHKVAALGLLVAVSAVGLGASVEAGSEYEDVSKVTLLPGWQRADGLYMAAVQIDLAPGWKTYWRAPGNNGIAPIFDWSASENIEQVGYYWPSPRIIDYKGVRTIGYADQLILPILLKPREANAPLKLHLRLDYGVCDDVCIPAKSRATLAVDRSQVLNQVEIEEALALRSTPATDIGLSSASCTLRPHEDDFVLNAEFGFSDGIEEHRVVVIETGSEQIWVSEADHAIDGGSLRVEADLLYYGSGAMTFDRGALRFTMINDGQSIEISGCSGG